MAKKGEGFFYNVCLTLWMIVRVSAFFVGIVAICFVIESRWGVQIYPALPGCAGRSVSFVPNLPRNSILVDNFRSKEKAGILMRQLRRQYVYARLHREQGIFFVYVDTFPTFSNTSYGLRFLHERGYLKAQIVHSTRVN